MDFLREGLSEQSSQILVRLWTYRPEWLTWNNGSSADPGLTASANEVDVNGAVSQHRADCRRRGGPICRRH